MKGISFFYPSFTRKALTFTIDDGNMTYDAKFIAITKQGGIKGTFNLCSDIHEGREREAREFYEGYDIANHCKYHPFVNYDNVELLIGEDFDESTADPRYIYPVKGREGFYWYKKPNGWRYLVMQDDFNAYIEQSRDELNAIFGEGRVKDFVWPFCEHDNASVRAAIRRLHRSARKTGCTLDSTGFALPSDKYAWSYNANHQNLLEVMKLYEAYPDDGELKFFAFGVHAIDFERDQNWCDLEEFTRLYGSRPGTYWYASVGEIFDYMEAIDALVITDGEIVNNSDISVYAEIDGERRIVEARGSLKL